MADYEGTYVIYSPEHDLYLCKSPKKSFEWSEDNYALWAFSTSEEQVCKILKTLFIDFPCEMGFPISIFALVPIEQPKGKDDVLRFDKAEFFYEKDLQDHCSCSIVIS